MSDSDGQMYFDELPAPDLVSMKTVDEIYESADAAYFSQVHEDSRIEKKLGKIKPRQLGEYLSMWANTTGGGLVAVGVADKGELVGLSGLSAQQINALEQTGVDFCPDARFDTKRLEFVHDSGDHDFILLFRVKYAEDKAVSTVKGEYFVRIGDQKHKLKDDLERRELRDSKGEIRSEMETVPLEYPDDFDIRSIEQFSEAVKKRDELGDELNCEEILSRQLLGKRRNNRFVPNLACALLFAQNPRIVAPGCRIRFLRFDGEEEGSGEKWNAVKDQYIEGTIPEQIEECARVLTSQLRSFSRMGPGGKFFTADEYPKAAWYEAVVNACVHRTYSNGLRNADIFVKMFDDRLEITSPGSFMPFVTPENIYTVMSVPRNPFLMGAMRYLDYVKVAREGTRRMKVTMGEMGLPEPEFKASRVENAHVRVILRNRIKHRKAWVDSDVIGIVGASLARTLTDLEKRCLNFVAENEKISVSDTQRLTSKSWQASKNLLDKLVERGVLVHHHRPDLERDPKARYTFPMAQKDE